MSADFEQLLGQYDYAFPPEAVAQKPAEPRDSARLLVCSRDNDERQYDVYRNIGKYLPAGTVLVMNETKVVPARLEVVKPTGGTARVLFVGEKSGDFSMLKMYLVMSDRKLVVGSIVRIAQNNTRSFLVQGQEDKYYVLVPEFSDATVDDVLERYGTMPLPPYINEHGMKESELRARYQTVFARERGSVAAPTASLHFTPEILASLRAQGVIIEYFTLHVGLGTFAPLTEEHVSNGVLHHEKYVIDVETAKRINEYKIVGRKIVAVGTTVVRTLESAANEEGFLTRLTGETGLFIREGYSFRVIDGLITNFHVPKSSLLMLVSAFVGRERVLSMYLDGIAKGYRLFSFGDGMLIL